MAPDYGSPFRLACSSEAKPAFPLSLGEREERNWRGFPAAERREGFHEYGPQLW